MKMMKSLLSMTVIACGAMAVVSCNKSDDVASGDLSELKLQVYNQAFTGEFGQPAADQNWGFDRISMWNVMEPTGSYEFFLSQSAGAPTRSVAESVTAVNKQTYSSQEELYALAEAKCYFYLRVDNAIVQQEKQDVQANRTECYYPKKQDLGNGVKDTEFNTDNEGLIKIQAWRDLGVTENNNGVTFATDDVPIPESIFAKAPTLETMALHISDADKIKLAGSVENFLSNYKIFWYVAKWQNNQDKAIHVDGVLVPKDQITVNVPEYKKRIIVEDLRGNINATTKVSGSDFDFNDVVFDAVTWNRNNQQHLKIIVRAAGGRLPIYVQGKEVHEGLGYMFNTANPDYTFGKVLVEDEIIGTGNAATFDFSSIPVEVEIDGEKSAAGSDIGQAPEKIAVGLDYQWCTERQSIKAVYPKFTDYVSDKTVTNWWK